MILNDDVFKAHIYLEHRYVLPSYSQVRLLLIFY